MMKITEREVEAAIDIQLTSLGWKIDPRKSDRNVYRQQARTQEQKKQLGRNLPDYVLYAFKDSDKPSIVIEAKKPGESLSNALEQGKSRYAEKIGAPIVIATDGWRVRTWHMERGGPLFIDEREVEDLISPTMARNFIADNNFSSFSKEVALKQSDLIANFAKANDILKHEGLSAGIERFSEFANLMFLKLKFEGGGKQDISGFSWADVCSKQGTALLDVLKAMLRTQKKEHSGLFENTKIKNPKNLERLVDILSSFHLSSVKDDIKGLAFEHFIHSYTRGTKNDLGQYFTPRHIVRMMVHFLQPRIGEKIYDPFCGTGGMLVECFRYLNQRISTTKDKDTLRKNTLFGRDNSSVARIAMMNMIMFGDGHSNIQRGDSYSLLEETKHKYDIVITNIPFSQSTDYSADYPVQPSGRKNGDSIGVQHCLESVKNSSKGRAAIIVPIGFFYKDELKDERKYILGNWEVDRFIELTPQCFQPYTLQQTAIMFLSRGNSKKSFPYFQIKNDGYSQDGYRIPLPGENDIDRTMDDLGGKEVDIASDTKVRFKTLDFFVKKDEFQLSDVAKITSGANSISPKTKIIDIIGGTQPIMMVADLSRNHIDYSLCESTYKINERAILDKKPHLFSKNSTLIPVTGQASLKNHRALLSTPAYATSTLAGIESKGDYHPFCIFYFFLNFDVESITYDLGYPGISVKTINKIGIPNYSDKNTDDIVRRISDAIELTEQLKLARQKVEF